MRTVFLCSLLCSAMLLMASCTKPQQAADGKQSFTQLLQNNTFTLIEANSAPVKSPRPITMEFNDSMRIAGQVCNRFMGQAEEKNGVLTVKQMGMTLMACPDQELNALEKLFGQMINAGVQLEQQNNTLILTQESNTLVYAITPKAK